MRRKALVTGGAGFIGSNLVTRLLKEGWEVTIFDNLSRKGSEKNLLWILHKYKTPKLNVLIKDVRNFNDLKETIKKTDVVYHLAAQVAVTTSFLNPREDFEINALGSFNVFEAARVSKHKPIVIFASTNKVYGSMSSIKVNEGQDRYNYLDMPEGISEDYPLDFHSPYACSNGVADQYALDYFRMYGVPTVVFRQSCIYGPRQMGTEDQGWVAYLAIAALLDEEIRIYGNGKQVRDLLHVDDLIEAYQLSIKKIKLSQGQAYNIGGSKDHSFSLLEYNKYLSEELNKKIKIKFKKWRPGDQKIYLSNTNKIRRHLHWEPRICHKFGLKDLISWVKSNQNLFDYQLNLR